MNTTAVLPVSPVSYTPAKKVDLHFIYLLYPCRHFDRSKFLLFELLLLILLLRPDEHLIVQSTQDDLPLNLLLYTFDSKFGWRCEALPWCSLIVFFKDTQFEISFIYFLELLLPLNGLPPVDRSELGYNDIVFFDTIDLP